MCQLGYNWRTRSRWRWIIQPFQSQPEFVRAWCSLDGRLRLDARLAEWQAITYPKSRWDKSNPTGSMARCWSEWQTDKQRTEHLVPWRAQEKDSAQEEDIIRRSLPHHQHISRHRWLIETYLSAQQQLPVHRWGSFDWGRARHWVRKACRSFN